MRVRSFSINRARSRQRVHRRHQAFELGLLEAAGQPVMAVEVNPQPIRGPRRHPHVGEPQFRIEEVKVVVQTLARLGLHAGSAVDLSCQG